MKSVAAEGSDQIKRAVQLIPQTALTHDDVGIALRKAYQRAVEEDVPSELLDLLHRLK